MAGLLRKSMIYLGLVDTEDEYDDEDDFDYDHRRDDYDQRHPVPAATAQQQAVARRVEPARAARAPRAERRPQPVAPVAVARSRDATAPALVEQHRRPTPAVVEPSPEPSYRITTLCPRTYNEARQIGEEFRNGTPVIMNLTQMSDADAKRLVDFAAGLIFGLHGSIERVTNKVFLLSPRNVSVSQEDKARIVEGGFFNQS